MSSNSEIRVVMDQLNVSRETIERLKHYEALLKKWNPVINLVSEASLAKIWSRHFLDSAQIWRMRPENAADWMDIGTGGGFPGLVITILAAQDAPGLSVHLVESDTRKAAFLRNTSLKLGLSPEIIVDRVEKLPARQVDVISARAVAPVTTLLGYCERHRKKNGVSLFLKGKNHEIELTEARKCWKFKVQKTPSITESGAVVLQIGGFGRV